MMDSPIRFSIRGGRSAWADSPRSGSPSASATGVKPISNAQIGAARKEDEQRETAMTAMILVHLHAVPQRSPRICKRMSQNILTHFDAAGQAHMVNVGAKPETGRLASAMGRIRMRAETLALIRAGDAKKGDVLGIARIAAIQAAKRTGELIPLCHPIPLTRVAVEFTLDEAASAIECEVVAQTVGRTGVEMEAMTAVAIALLTIYDMCKAADRGMVIESVRLLEKAGGKSGHWLADEKMRAHG